MKHKHLHEIAKFASGVIFADFLFTWWVGATGWLPIKQAGVIWDSSMVTPTLIFDAAVFIILVHYAWHLGRTPTLRSKSYFLLVGIILGVVALAHVMRLFTSADLVVMGWTVPLWLSWIGVVVAAYLSYMSFHLAVAYKK